MSTLVDGAVAGLEVSLLQAISRTSTMEVTIESFIGGSYGYRSPYGHAALRARERYC